MEEIKIDEVNVIKYLNKNNIHVSGSYFKTNKIAGMKDIEAQIKLIILLQKKISGLSFGGFERIESSIGKTLEDYKVQIKILNRDYNSILLNGNKNEVDKFILLEGKKMLNKGEKALNQITDELYFNIINRSMNRKEICIGRVDSGNLKYEDNNIVIGVIKNISYNLVEEDIYKYIKKIQKRNMNFNEDDIIKNFVYNAHLSYNSIHYLQALCMYPRDFLRNWERYRKNKSEKTEEYYLKEFKRAQKYEK